jgi:hypothetical protein
MTPDTPIIELAKRLAQVGAQVGQAYLAAEAELRLDLVLSRDRLSSTEGTAASLDVLERLTALTARHLAAYQRYVLAASAELTQAVAELPVDRQDEYRTGFVRALNQRLAEQGRFYEDRQRWIVAAQAICDLVESRRSTSTFGDEGIVFADEADAQAFTAHLDVIEEVHQAEVAAIHARRARIAQSAAILGAATRP